ncbi:hypothetical protein KY289_013090 [Solanum tuberosum]|nr:hypothetical protein KY289_013090 [Solanum tuberosum]
MGKNKSSRKGKKSWRANISTEDIEDFFDNSTKDALSGCSLAQVPSDSLFYVDKSRDLSVKRKIEKHREKVLRCDKVQEEKYTAQQDQKDLAGGDTGMVDILDDKGDLVIKTKKKPKTSVIPAVEVEPQGCSFNPPSESHQDALACAVADEMQKIYRNELGPEPIPLIVPGEAVNEEDMYFLEADSESERENENLVEDGKTDLDKRPQKPKMLTQVEKNRRARRKEQLKTEAEATKAAQLSKEIDSLPDIIQEIERGRRKTEKTSMPCYCYQRKTKILSTTLGKAQIRACSCSGGCCTLARDGFKSLEKRGLVVPSKKSSRSSPHHPEHLDERHSRQQGVGLSANLEWENWLGCSYCWQNGYVDLFNLLMHAWFITPNILVMAKLLWEQKLVILIYLEAEDWYFMIALTIFLPKMIPSQYWKLS